MNARIRQGAVGLCLVAMSGCASAFSTTTVSFAQTARQAAQSFPTEIDLAAQLCRRRARLEFLRNRVEGTPQFAWGQRPYWSEWLGHVLDEKSDPKESWATRCASVEDKEKAERRALAAVIAYSDALEALATAGHYSGGDLKDIATSVGTLINVDGSGAGDPLAQLLDILFADAVATEFRTIVPRADAPLHVLLDGLLRYAKTVGAELTDVQTRTADVLTDVDIKLKGTIDPAAAVIFYQFAAGADDELRALRRQQDLFAQIVAGVAQAHAKLAAAATESDGKRRAAALKEACVALAGVRARLASVPPAPPPPPSDSVNTDAAHPGATGAGATPGAASGATSGAKGKATDGQ